VGIHAVTKAVFLDRDGVINRNVFYSDTCAYESPRSAADFELFPDVLTSLQQLQAVGYSLFLVSNQPNVAKGKATLAHLDEIQSKLQASLDGADVRFAAFYYCLHHPDSTVPVYGGWCECRKPSPYFLKKAEAEYGVDLSRSWMVGDRISDIECGDRAGVRTILIDSEVSKASTSSKSIEPNYVASSLAEASLHILNYAGETADD
jgi:D-glycero-D-manno-heptose 1,7-bisphosphate phosphatase